ncbi:DUF4230 domain-containing protein [Polystyrenella longa]|nr:DUF4230 domain-containing protein [Polystyrenella longa]
MIQSTEHNVAGSLEATNHTDDSFLRTGQARTISLVFNGLFGFIAILLFAGVASLLYSQQQKTLTETSMASHIDETGRLRPLSEVAEITRSLNLVTVVIDSKVRVRMSADSWRGDVSAVVEAPVRYVYGVDLSNLEPNAFHAGKVFGGYDIEVPRPKRIAVEVDGSNPIDEVVQVTGTRFRTRAGEYYLGLARKKLYEQAKKETLSEEEMKKVHDTTKEQIEDLVRRFVGERAYVNVRYENKL